MEENQTTPTKASSGILSLTIKDKKALYSSYMPYLKNGGLFIPTNKTYELGNEVFILLNLLDEADKIPIAGEVAWITPKGSDSSRPAGIGVHFSDQDGGAARSKIETYLAGALQSERPTYTM